MLGTALWRASTKSFVNRLGLPTELCRSLARTNIIENVNGAVRRVCRNVKPWRDAAMALRWTGAAMLEAAKGLPPLQSPPSIAGPQGRLGRSRRQAHRQADP